MKFPLNEYQRRSILPLAGAALAAYYFMVFVPLKRHAEDLDAPVDKALRKLAVSLEQTNNPAIDFLSISNQLAETKHARDVFEDARQKAAARIELAQAVRARVSAPFQLVDFENERSKETESLKRLAAQHQIILEPAVFTGFPEHTIDIRRPELLWAALSTVDGLVRVAVESQVTVIHSLETTTLSTGPTWNNADRLAEIPLQVELTGSGASVSKLLTSLPLRGDELRTSGFPAAPLEKPPLFVDRLIIKKQSPEKPDEVRIFLHLIAFVMRESSQPHD